MNIKLILGTLLVFSSLALSYPKISSPDWCQTKNCKTTLKFCAIKPDSLRQGEISFKAEFLKSGGDFGGTIKPDKKGLKYRTMKPENSDPNMVVMPEFEIEMR